MNFVRDQPKLRSALIACEARRAPGQFVSGCDRYVVVTPPRNGGQENLAFSNIDRVGLKLNRVSTCQHNDPVNSCSRLHRGKRKQKIGHRVPSDEFVVETTTVEPVDETLLARDK